VFAILVATVGAFVLFDHEEDDDDRPEQDEDDLTENVSVHDEDVSDLVEADMGRMAVRLLPLPPPAPL
jgi:hypothetical protein